jgi:peroxiredoxin
LRELPHIEALHKEYAPRGLQVVAVSVDDTRSEVKAKSYVKTHGFTFNVLFDPNQRALRDLQGVTCPYLVLVSPEGERLYTHSGYRDGDEKELAKVVAETMATWSTEGKSGKESDGEASKDGKDNKEGKDAGDGSDADAVPAGENGDNGSGQEGG